LFFLLQKLKKKKKLFFLITNKKYKNVSTSALTESKLGWGAKIATKSKLKGPEKSCFFRGSKSQLWKT